MKTERNLTQGNVFYRDADLSVPEGKSLWDDCPIIAIQQDPTIGAFYRNDFRSFVTTMDGLTSVLTDTGSVTLTAATAGRNGMIALTPSDGTVADNDEVELGETVANWILSGDRTLWFETEIKFTEGNTDDINVMVGLSSTYAHQSLVDAGAGPMVNFSGMAFYKVLDGTTWNTITSLTTTQQKTTAVATRVSGSWTRLGIKANSSAVKFYINGVLVSTHTTATAIPTAGMGLIYAVKNGAVTTVETLYVDWVQIAQLKRNAY